MALAYFLTWTCHGTWIPGDERGWVDSDRNVYGTPVERPDAALEEKTREQNAVAGRELGAAEREVVRRAIEDHCEHAGWRMLALNVRTNHVHCVVAAPSHAPEVVMGQLKAWATRRLREAGSRGEDDRVWTREGSTRHLFDETALANAVRYVTTGQGEALD